MAVHDGPVELRLVTIVGIDRDLADVTGLSDALHRRVLKPLFRKHSAGCIQYPTSAQRPRTLPAQGGFTWEAAGANHAHIRLNNALAFTPPKPNPLVNANSISAFRGPPATIESPSANGSGRPRLSVAGAT
ncbi:hypothetical protein D3C73_806310 [compost metagenome]